MIVQPDEGLNKANYYGSCATAAETQAKTVTIDGFVLEEGARISVFFSNMNTAMWPTLNVSGTGAYRIMFGDGIEFYNYNALYELCEFVYVKFGTSSRWMYVGHPASTLRNDAIGYTEFGTVSIAAHSTGSYITWKDKFYKVSATIAAGDTLAVGTNLTEAKVGDEISELKTLTSGTATLLNSTYLSDGRLEYYKLGRLVICHGYVCPASFSSTGYAAFIAFSGLPSAIDTWQLPHLERITTTGSIYMGVSNAFVLDNGNLFFRNYYHAATTDTSVQMDISFSYLSAS